MVKDKKQLSLKYAVLIFLCPTIVSIIFKYISYKFLGTYFILFFSIGNIASISSAYFIVNKGFKEISVDEFIKGVIPLYFTFMSLIGFLIYLLAYM